MISVVLAVYNEAATIERCLRSVTSFAGEIVVVDGSSTDETVAIAKRLGAIVISTTNKLNFHINKQMAMDKAKGNLVLQLDADEVVDQELATFITTLAGKLERVEEKAWYIPRKNYFLGTFLTKGGQYPDPVIRLYVRGFARLPQQDVHEQIKVEGKVGWAGGHLIHYGNPTFADYLRKFNTYTTFKATQLQTAQVPFSLVEGWRYLIWLPLSTFFSLYIRHKGFQDKVAGFVFAAMSGLHHLVAYLKYWELAHTPTNA